MYLGLYFLCQFLSVFGNPTFSVQPSSSILVNSSVNLTCTFNNGLDLGVTFKFPGNILCSFGFVSNGSKCTLCGTLETICLDNRSYTVKHYVSSTWNAKKLICMSATSEELKSQSDTFNVKVRVADVNLVGSHDVVDEGQSLNLTCKTNHCNPRASINWYKGFQKITSGITNSFHFDSNSLEMTTSVLEYRGLADDNGLQVYCTANNLLNNTVVSSNITLDVKYAPPADPVIIVNSSLPVHEGQTIALQCSLSTLGNPPITWSWVCGDDDLTLAATNKSTQSTLTFNADRKYNQRTCQCQATSPRPSLTYNRTSKTRIISVYYEPTTDPVLIMNSSVPVDEGQPITLQCSLSTLGNPPITWSWVCGDDDLTVTATNKSTQSTLTFRADRKYNQRTCQCRATSPKPSLYDRTSDTRIITVYYLPVNNPLITGSSLFVDEGQTVILRCSLGDLGNPPITWNWVCGGNNLTKEATNSEKQSTLTFTADKQYNQRTCQCWATSLRKPLMYNKTSEERKITVYFQVEIKNVTFTEGSNNMTAGNPVKIVAIIEGNPTSTVTWKIKDSNRTLLQNDSVSTTSELTFSQASCLDSNEYTVTAYNGKGTMAMKNIYLNIMCVPYLSMDNEQDPIAVGDENHFVITRKYIANPQATVQWTKIDNPVNKTLKNESQHLTIYNFAEGKVQYSTVLERKNVNDSDIGLYYLYLENSLGKVFTVAEVIFKRSPDFPSNIFVSCIEPFEAKVYWTAEFDGGGNQTFFVFFSQQDWNTYKKSSIYVHGRRGEDKFITISDLQPNIEYKFKVYAENRYGNVSSKSVYCTIKDEKEKDSLVLITSSVVASSLFIIIFVVIAVYWYRRNVSVHRKGINWSASRNVLNEEQETEEDDGLKDNILYESAGPKDEKPEVTVYAAVVKKTPESNNNANIYAEVKKRGQNASGMTDNDVKSKSGLKKKDDKLKKDVKLKQKKGNKLKKKSEVADVYENSEDIAMSSKSDNVYSNTGQKVQNKEERGYKNKDGLLYVEVQFDAITEKGNQTIHGEDEKTDYATVEFPVAASTYDESGNEKM